MDSWIPLVSLSFSNTISLHASYLFAVVCWCKSDVLLLVDSSASCSVGFSVTVSMRLMSGVLSGTILRPLILGCVFNGFYSDSLCCVFDFFLVEVISMVLRSTAISVAASRLFLSLFFEFFWFLGSWCINGRFDTSCHRRLIFGIYVH